MKSLFKTKRIFLIGGPGGVGKTTLSAALGVAAARQGYRTLVLTVDPARRLAQALGFSQFGREIEEVRLTGHSGPGTLHASMLDSQRYFDRIIERFASSDAHREKILRHPLYRLTIDHLGGTHEYAAMERLLEFASERQFDKIIVDTPPAQNALDLFSAPERLASFMDNSVVKWFERRRGGIAERLFQQGTRVAMKVLQTVLGSSFLENLAGFLEDLGQMREGFRRRHLEVMELLRSAESAFFLVSVPQQARHEESIAFHEALKQQRIPLEAILLNRIEPASPTLSPIPPGLSAPARQGLEEALRYSQALHAQDTLWVERFQKTFFPLPVRCLFKEWPRPNDLDALSRLGERLLQ